MKTEPLKNKSIKLKRHQSFGKNIDHTIYQENDVKSAVEWLKEELHKNTDAKSRTSLFQVSDIIKVIDEAFPDLCPSGEKKDARKNN